MQNQNFGFNVSFYNNFLSANLKELSINLNWPLLPFLGGSSHLVRLELDGLKMM